MPLKLLAIGTYTRSAVKPNLLDSHLLTIWPELLNSLSSSHKAIEVAVISSLVIHAKCLVDHCVNDLLSNCIDWSTALSAVCGFIL